MSSKTNSQSSNAGIVTDAGSGERHIPASTRSDGSTRKAIKIRPGYRPPEDVEVYKNRTAETFRNRGKGGIPGAEGLKDDKPDQGSAASNKNAKRREARKKAATAAAAAEGGETRDSNDAIVAKADTPAAETTAEHVDPEAERQKKARNLRKKLNQAKELKDKKEGGAALLPEQIAKVIKINELIRELDALGFDSEGEPKDRGGEADAGQGEKGST